MVTCAFVVFDYRIDFYTHIYNLTHFTRKYLNNNHFTLNSRSIFIMTEPNIHIVLKGNKHIEYKTEAIQHKPNMLCLKLTPINRNTLLEYFFYHFLYLGKRKLKIETSHN